MNPVLLQKQLKENASDLQDFCKDLKSWGEEMKRKEESLKNEDNSKKPKVQTTKAPSTSKDVPKEKMSRIGSTDYSKWEKFNADLECERLEDDFKDDSELTDEFEENTRDEALVHKEKGNSYVKMKEWDKAIDCYTKAINCYSYDPVFYANRALCYLKKNSFIAAEEDCTLSLKLDSTYVKALQRRAAAREALGKYEQAVNDLELVLIHEPKNKESTTVLEHIKKKIGTKEQLVNEEQRPISKFTASRNRTQSIKPTISTSSVKIAPQKVNPISSNVDTSVPSASDWPDPGGDIIHVKPIKKPPHIRSKKLLKRIEIAEIDSVSKNEESSENLNKVPEAFKQYVIEHIEQDINASEPVEKTSAFKTNREKIKNIQKEYLNENAWPKADFKGDVIKSGDLKVLENKPKEAKNTENIFLTKMDNKGTTDVANKEFSVPKTSVQFHNTWKTIKTPEDKYRYLKLIIPQDIPKIFRESLESAVFSGILEVLCTNFIENNDEVYEYLLQLTQVKRFSALAMFMDSTDKNRLWKLIAYLKENDKVPRELVDNLALEYEL